MTEPLIMIIDDDDDLRMMISLVIEAHGFRAIGAIDGIDALAKLEHGTQPALILLDLRMPRMNGTEFLRALHRTPAAAIPVIGLTGDPGAAQEALEAGASSCLRKPTEPRALIDAIRKHTSSVPGETGVRT